MAKTWEEILNDPFYSGVISNIQTSLTLSAQGSGVTGLVNQTAADYGKPEYSKKGAFGSDTLTAINAAVSPELSYLRANPKTVIEIMQQSTVGLSPQQRQNVISGTVGSMGKKWGGASQKTAGEILQTELQKLGEIETNKQGWLPSILGYVEKLAESSGTNVGGLLESIGQTMEDEWSPYDD